MSIQSHRPWILLSATVLHGGHYIFLSSAWVSDVVTTINLVGASFVLSSRSSENKTAYHYLPAWKLIIINNEMEIYKLVELLEI